MFRLAIALMTLTFASPGFAADPAIADGSYVQLVRKHVLITQDLRVSLNHASKEQLMRSLDLSPLISDAIIASRPFYNPDDLVSRHILTPIQMDILRDKVSLN